MVAEFKEEKAIEVKQTIDTAMTTRGGLVPSNLEQMWRLASIMAKSGLMPKGLQTPEAVCVAVQMGLEIGLTPMQAVQNIAVINGRPSVWGDSGIALVEASGFLEDFKETIEENDGIITATCWAKRKGRPTPVERTFSTIDAKQAGLHDKEGPWKQYPKRMTQMRARWWVLRDLFADVLKGLHAAEEVQDIPIDVTPLRPELPPAKAGEVKYEVKSAKPEEPDPKVEAPKSTKEPANPKVVEEPPFQPSEPAGSNLPDKDSEKETDTMDDDTRAFVTEAERYCEVFYETESGKSELEKLLKHYRMTGKAIKDFPVDMRSAFLKQCKVRVDKMNQ